ncbi:MAG: hypothetical protein GQ536_03425 [Candidatus Aminicenantes bacterium]|nr:hypothetical protein [Candidatus Aminicenantes bacterium]
MSKTISEKEIRIKQKDAKKGGVMLLRGKERSKYNALKDSILSENIRESEGKTLKN